MVINIGYNLPKYTKNQQRNQAYDRTSDKTRTNTNPMLTDIQAVTKYKIATNHLITELRWYTALISFEDIGLTINTILAMTAAKTAAT